jgi:hypothetical protein
MRTKERKDELGEVFTPIDLVNEMFDRFPSTKWEDHTDNMLDPTCGNGNFLVEAKNRYLPFHSENHILENMIFGADIMEDNIRETIERLWGPGEITGTKDKKKIKKEKMTAPGLIKIFYHNGKLVRNIVQADGLLYDYSFGRPKEDIVEGVIAAEENKNIESEILQVKEELKMVDFEGIQW